MKSLLMKLADGDRTGRHMATGLLGGAAAGGAVGGGLGLLAGKRLAKVIAEYGAGDMSELLAKRPKLMLGLSGAGLGAAGLGALGLTGGALTGLIASRKKKHASAYGVVKLAAEYISAYPIRTLDESEAFADKVAMAIRCGEAMAKTAVNPVGFKQLSVAFTKRPATPAFTAMKQIKGPSGILPGKGKNWSALQSKLQGKPKGPDLRQILQHLITG